MAANARLVVQMTAKEKRALEARAKQAGMSTSEFVRRRVAADELFEHRDEIEALLSTLESSGPGILESVDAAIAAAAKLNAELGAKQGSR